MDKIRVGRDGGADQSLIEEGLALLAAFRQIKSAEARSTIVWLAQSLADDSVSANLLKSLSASASPRTRRLDRAV